MVLSLFFLVGLSFKTLMPVIICASMKTNKIAIKVMEEDSRPLMSTTGAQYLS